MTRRPPHHSKTVKTGATLLTCGLAPATALAQGATHAVEAGGGMLQVIFSLLLVAVLLAGSLYLLKHLNAPRGATASLLRVISGAAVGARERVVVVEVGETWLVLGVAPGQVTKLHELPRQSLAAAKETAVPEKNFAAWLKQVVDRRNAAK